MTNKFRKLLKSERNYFLIGIFALVTIIGLSNGNYVENVYSLTELDRDHDGIPDESDECPQFAETYNKFQDDDGCPDSVTDSEIKTKFTFSDSDGDGYEDRIDKCVNLPETFNGYLDDDGCPEIVPENFDKITDFDADSVPDSIDACPAEKETFNGFRDGDGCPDSLVPLNTSKNPVTKNDHCRDNKIQVLRINSNDVVCVSKDTAIKWEQYGIGKIMEPLDSVDLDFETSDEIVKKPKEFPKFEPGKIESIKTRLGFLTLESNYPTKETQSTLTDELFFQRATQVYLLTTPALSGAGIFYDKEKIGASNLDVIYWSDFLTSDTEILTGNISVLYSVAELDLNYGPVVLEIPEGLYGGVNNLYQQPIVDIDSSGPDEGAGGKFLITPPGYQGELPDGYFIEQSDTMWTFLATRAFVSNNDKQAAEHLVKEIKIYPLSEASNPPKQKFIDVLGVPLKMSYPTTDGYWRFLHNVYSKEPVTREQDKILLAMMKSIGIIPGELFEPDAHSMKLLNEAALVGEIIAKGLAFNSPHKDPYVAYPDSEWEIGFHADNPYLEDEKGIPLIDERVSFGYQAITTNTGMVENIVGSGSKYLIAYRDGDGEWLTGSNSYRLHIPSNVPAERFWSVVVYDTDTRSQIQNGLQTRPGISSLNSGNLVKNDDGSFDVFFGSNVPDENPSNWIKTNEGKGFFVIFRFYSPTEKFFDKTWQLPNIEKIDD